ncbi:MAG: hypothetical protein FWF23_02305 [Alphaproteobacteria bacterium]|nr:hypothetical protein [Alphaproteobacteria bacterium]MCL2505854.1 hypothetical protein [Alphaproteobacteria bacterium]
MPSNKSPYPSNYIASLRKIFDNRISYVQGMMAETGLPFDECQLIKQRESCDKNLMNSAGLLNTPKMK